MILVRIRSQTPEMLKVLIILSNYQLRFCDIYHMVSKFVYIPLLAFLLSRLEVPKHRNRQKKFEPSGKLKTPVRKAPMVTQSYSQTCQNIQRHEQPKCTPVEIKWRQKRKDMEKQNNNRSGYVEQVPLPPNKFYPPHHKMGRRHQLEQCVQVFLERTKQQREGRKSEMKEFLFCNQRIK